MTQVSRVGYLNNHYSRSINRRLEDLKQCINSIAVNDAGPAVVAYAQAVLNGAASATLGQLPFVGGTAIADSFATENAEAVGSTLSIDDIKHALSVEIERLEEQIQRNQRRNEDLMKANNYAAGDDVEPDMVAYIKAVLDGATSATRLPSRNHLKPRPVVVILLRDLDEPRDKVKIRIYDEILLTAKDIAAALHNKCQLDADISPRLYVKHLKAHKRTNQGTKWKLVDTTERLEPNLKELHGVFRKDSYTLVLLGRRWIWMRDTTRILGCDAPRHSLQGITLRRFEKDAVVKENDWPLESDYYLCNVYGRM